MKNILTVVGLFIILAIAIQPVIAQTVQVPNVQVGTFSSVGKNLASGSGDREITVAVTFPKPFASKPEVVVALNTVDADKGANMRINIKAMGITRDGFIVVIKTWADSKINAVEGSWVAVAPATVKVSEKK